VSEPFSPIVIEANNPGPMTGRGTNTYLVIGGGAATLVDAGVGEAGHLAALDASLDLHHAELERVVVTHGHSDHASGAAALARRHGAIVAKYPWPGVDGRYGVGWEPLAEGDVIAFGGESLHVLHTPGHSPDHLVFWHERSRTAFTGDLVIAGSSVMIHWSQGGNLQQYLAALERLRSLEPRRLLPAHGPPILEPRDVLTRYLAHRRVREQQVLASLEAGLETVQAITESIYHDLAPTLLAAAAENVRAHLEKLRAEGRASEDHGRWRV
jgi:glyoxylase-like metal-dependent hydrolase (beta-lactamase superfamily II)